MADIDSRIGTVVRTTERFQHLVEKRDPSLPVEGTQMLIEMKEVYDFAPDTSDLTLPKIQLEGHELKVKGIGDMTFEDGSNKKPETKEKEEEEEVRIWFTFKCISFAI